MRHKSIDVAESLNRFAAWSRPKARDLQAAARWTWTWMSTTGKGCHHLVRQFEPWGIVITLFGLVFAAIALMVDLADRQSERTFRAWQVVREYENREGTSGSALREALQFLNRDFVGAVCKFPIGWFSQWLTGNRRECLFPLKNRESLAGLEARRVDLEGIDLSGADLSEATLLGVTLRDAILRDATLRDATLKGADLVKADLSRADLTGVDLSFVSWDGRVNVALLEHGLSEQSMPVDFSKALRLPDGSFTCADLSEAFKQAREGTPRAHTDLSEADLSKANLSKANLLGANLTDADLSDADLSGAYLLCADLTGATYEGANLSDADTAGAVLPAGFTPLP